MPNNQRYVQIYSGVQRVAARLDARANGGSTSGPRRGLIVVVRLQKMIIFQSCPLLTRSTFTINEALMRNPAHE